MLAEGNVIFIGPSKLEVAQACNGLSMLLSFITLITAHDPDHGPPSPALGAGLLLASTIPIALVSNILRIAATAWAYQVLGEARGQKIAHDTAGWAMMPIALGLIWIELKIMNWLIVEEEVENKLDHPHHLQRPVPLAEEGQGPVNGPAPSAAGATSPRDPGGGAKCAFWGKIACVLQIIIDSS